MIIIPYIDLKIRYDKFDKHKEHKFKYIGEGEEIGERYAIFYCLKCFKYFRIFKNEKLT